MASFPLLKSINVRFNAEGHLMLANKRRHGCAVFPTGGRQFALSATALEDDAWAEEAFAGSYCVGVIDVADIDHIHPASDSDVDDARAMVDDVGCHYALSTGSFKLCGTDDLWESRLFNTSEEDRVFPGSLTRGRTLAMEFAEGTLTYKLDMQSRSFNLASGERLLPLSRNFDEGKGSKGWLRAPKGAGKGKAQSAGKSGKDAGREPARFAPCIWMFAVPSSDHTSAIQVRLLDYVKGQHHVPSKRMRTLWDERRFADCTIECGGEQIPAHRAVLCAASPVFSAAFEGSMREAKEARYSIGGCTEPQVVKAMLKFVYTGRLPELSAEELAQLLPLAAQYSLDDLCAIAADRLVTKVTVNTVRETVRVIRQFRDKGSVSGAYASLLSILKTNDDLLGESLV